MSLPNRKYKRSEFFGLSGSGKSTLHKKLPGENTVRYGCDKKHFWFWFWLIIVQLVKVRQLVRLFGLKRCLLKDTYNKKGKVIKDYVVVDEGWLQRVLSFYEVKITMTEVKRACGKIDLPDKIIIMNRNVDDCVTRQMTAPHIRSFCSQEYLKNWRENYIHNFNLFKNHLKELDSVTIVEATVHSDPEMLIK